MQTSYLNQLKTYVHQHRKSKGFKLQNLIGFSASDLSAISAIASTFIALLAFFSAIWVGITQRNHNKLSVRPLAEIEVRDMKNHILIKLRNNGTGPLIIKNLKIIEDSKIITDSLIKCMPREQLDWTFFVGTVDNRSLRPNGELTLIELEYDPKNEIERLNANLVRKKLSKLEIVVEYKNIYNNEMPKYQKNLEWFGRLLK